MKNQEEKSKYLQRSFLEKQRLIILSITKRCNLCCKYCRTNDIWYDVLGQKSGVLDLHREKWTEILDIYRSEDAGEILITGGEPTEYSLLEDFLIFLDKNRIRFSIHTNGISKKWPDIFSFLKKNNLVPDIHLSTELFPELQKELRSDSELPLEFIADVKKLGLLLELKINLHQKLLPYKNQLKDNLYFWINRGVDSIFFQPIVPVGKNFPSGLEIDKNFISFLLKLRELKIKDLTLNKVIRNSAVGLDVIISFIEGVDLYRRVAEKCNVYNQIIFINPDLKILNCKSLWDKKKNVPCSKNFDFICCGFQS